MSTFKVYLRAAWTAIRTYRSAPRRIAVGVLIGTTFVVIVTFAAAAPTWMWEGYGDTLVRLEAVVKVVTPLVILFGLYIAWRRSLAHDRQAETAAMNAEIANRNAKTAEQGQITERFTRAVEQLADERLAVRLGGIYALERIANDSDDRDHKVVFEVLCAFVREKRTPGNEEEDLGGLPQDMQAVMSVIRRRERVPKGERIDLQGADLRRANLVGANLTRAYLFEAHLEGAFLSRAHMVGAYLSEASLVGANLSGSHLKEASLEGAHMKKAFLGGANLVGAILSRVNLEGADLSWANLKGADLSTATGLTTKQLVDAYHDATTHFPHDLPWPENWPPEEE